MSTNISDITQGLIELVEEVSHDPEETDWYDVTEYIENLPNPYNTLKQFVQWAHEELM